jgi:cell division cycle protein 20 (cofactor of APC complex)
MIMLEIRSFVRILCMAMSPDGRTVLSASADETLRFWRVFDVETASPKPKQESNRYLSVGGI